MRISDAGADVGMHRPMILWLLSTDKNIILIVKGPEIIWQKTATQQQEKKKPKTEK